MHLAHELLAQLDPGDPVYGAVMRAVKFDLGDAEDVYEMSKIATGQFTRPPFPACLFQIQKSVALYDMMLTTMETIDGAECLVMRWAEKGQSGWLFDGGQLRLSFGEKNWDFYDQDGNVCTEELMSDPVKKMLAGNFFAVARCLEVFSCCNVTQVEHAGPKLINAKRAKKGKPPIFSYRTLHITGDAAPRLGETPKGDRNSPRLHLRRGHIRTLADGRKIWVRSSVVGSKENGFVHKDYKVSLSPQRLGQLEAGQ